MKKVLKIALACMLCLSLMTVALATTVNGAQKTWQASDGRTYTNYASVASMSNGSGVKAAAVTYADEDLPAGQIGAIASLLNASGSTVSSTQMLYNGANTFSIQATTGLYTNYGNYKGYGLSDVWNSSTGKYFTTACTVTKNLAYFASGSRSSALEAPIVALMRAGEDGLERGTLDQVGPNGEHARLIRAVGSSGVVGYVLFNDLTGCAATPAEAVAREGKNRNSPTLIPLYAADGITVIGMFG